jgi:hypothetical protein
MVITWQEEIYGGAPPSMFARWANWKRGPTFQQDMKDWIERVKAVTAGTLSPNMGWTGNDVPQESLQGLGTRGEPLDIPDPSKNLPPRVRGRLVLIAYACAYAQARRGRTAHECPHKHCALWPHRTARWPEAEKGQGTAEELHAYLKRLTGDDPPNMTVACDDNSGFGRRKLPNMGGLGSTGGRVAMGVATSLKTRVTVTTCEFCGKSISGRRSKRFCSHRCQVRASRQRV